jgi:hypothetical protein
MKSATSSSTFATSCDDKNVAIRWVTTAISSAAWPCTVCTEQEPTADGWTSNLAAVFKVGSSRLACSGRNQTKEQCPIRKVKPHSWMASLQSCCKTTSRTACHVATDSVAGAPAGPGLTQPFASQTSLCHNQHTNCWITKYSSMRVQVNALRVPPARDGFIISRMSREFNRVVVFPEQLTKSGLPNILDVTL